MSFMNKALIAVGSMVLLIGIAAIIFFSRPYGYGPYQTGQTNSHLQVATMMSSSGIYTLDYHLVDSNYVELTPEGTRKLFEDYQAYKRKNRIGSYKKEVRDCDDSARLFCARAMEVHANYSSTPLMIGELYLTNHGCLVIGEGGKLRIMEVNGVDRETPEEVEWWRF